MILILYILTFSKLTNTLTNCLLDKNVVKNGDFESGDLTPWECRGSNCVITNGVLGFLLNVQFRKYKISDLYFKVCLEGLKTGMGFNNT